MKDLRDASSAQRLEIISGMIRDNEQIQEKMGEIIQEKRQKEMNPRR